MKNCKNNSNNQNIGTNINRRKQLALRLEKDANNVYYFYKLRRRGRI